MTNCVCPPPNTRNYYRYYDTPDGCDIDKKILAATRYGVTAGLIISTYDVMMFSHAVGLGNMMKRYMKHTIPLGLMGATFAAVANGLQQYRQKDDYLNYFAGGFSCGPILAAYLGSMHAVVLGGLVLGVGGIIKKDAVDTGVTIFPEVPEHRDMVNSWRHDYTLAQDPRDLMMHTCGKDKKK